MRKQIPITDRRTKGIAFIFFGCVFLFLIGVFIFVLGGFSELAGNILFVTMFGLGAVAFIAAGILNLNVAAHPELLDRLALNGTRMVGIIFLVIGVFTGALTVWFLSMGLLRNYPAAAVFCMLFTALFFFFGTFMYRNRLASFSWSGFARIDLNVKEKRIVVYGKTCGALVSTCIILMIVGCILFIIGTVCLKYYRPFIIMDIVGGAFTIYGIWLLKLSKRKDFKIIYKVLEPQSIKKSKTDKAQNANALQGATPQAIPYVESPLEKERRLPIEAEMESQQAEIARQQAEAEEHRRKVEAWRALRAIATKKAAFMARLHTIAIVAGLVLLVPFLVCLWCDFEIFEVLRSFSTTIFWYDDSIGRLFSHALRWLPALVVGCGLLVFGLYRKWMIKKKQAKYIDNQNDKSANAIPEVVCVEGETNLRTKIRNFKSRHPKLFVAACVAIGLIVCYIVFCVVVIIITTFVNS